MQSALAWQEEEFYEDISSTKRVLAELRDVLEPIEAQPSNGLVDPIKQWSLDAKELELEAAESIRICTGEAMKRLVLRSLRNYRSIRKGICRIQGDMLLILERGEMIGVNNKKQQEPDTSSLEDTTSKSSIYASATSAMRVLEVALARQAYLVPPEIYREVRSTRSELLPLFEILNQVVNETEDERQRVWMQIVENIFKSIEKESTSFHKLLLEQKGEPLIFRESRKKRLLLSLIMKRKGGISQATKFCKLILRKKKQIFMLWNRWHTYEVAPFKGQYGSKLVVPHMEPGMLRSKLGLPAEGKWKDHQLSLIDYSLELIELDKSAKELEPMEGFKIDMEFMDALWKDAEGIGEVDERGRIWLKYMMEFHRELKAVYEKCNIAFRTPFSQAKLLRRRTQAEQRREQLIYWLTMRKRYYYIDSFVHRDGYRSNHTQHEPVLLPSNLFKGDRVELVQMELHLMEALFQDVKTISRLDARLKVWLEEMHCLAKHSKPIIQQILKGSFTSMVASIKIDWIAERIRKISEWNLSYCIARVKSEPGSLSLTQELEEIGPYPTDPVAEQVDLIRREARLMRALDIDVQQMHEINSGTLEAWLEEMREVAGEAEILISNYSNNGEIINSRSEVIQNVELVKSKIHRLHHRRSEYGIKYFDRKLSCTAEELRARLLADESETRIIPILGAWDNDKAFIRKFIEEEDCIVYQFALQIWLSTGEGNEGTILENIERVIVQKNSNGSLIVSQAEEILEEGFTQNRFLIVLDEIKSSFILDSVRELLRTSKGSRVILITSQINVDLSALNPSEMLSSITMRVLPLQKNMSLLQMVPENSDKSSTTPNPSAETIPSYLRNCLHYFSLFSPKQLKGSGNYIPIRRLISLWVAEGFVRPKRGEDDIPLELIAERYLSELMKLGIVEAKEKGGKLKRCRLKDNERESCLNKAKEDQFLQEKKTTPGQGKYFGDEIGNIFRLSDQPEDVNYNSCHKYIHDPDNHPTSLTSHYRYVRSFLSFDTQERSKPGEDIGEFLDKGITKRCFLSLCILDLEHIFRPALPKELAKLIRLRYLGLRWTYLEALPPSVSELLNLQVLDVKHTYISKLPQSIWRMQYLRHLYLSETYRSRFDGEPNNSLSLENLQTLWGAFVDEDSPVEGGLDTLRNVRKLGLLCRSMYDCKKMASQLEAVANWVYVLKDLESLRLKSQDEKGMPSDLYLRPLSAHGNLSVLHIAGILKYPSVISDLPLNLTEVTLSGCELEHDPLHSMQYLPRLIIVRLLGHSSKCREMRCSSRGFPKLELLRLWKLEMLEDLEVEEGGMPLLQDFEIRSCPNLKKLPGRLEHVCKRTVAE